MRAEIIVKEIVYVVDDETDDDAQDQPEDRRFLTRAIAIDGIQVQAFQLGYIILRSRPSLPAASAFSFNTSMR